MPFDSTPAIVAINHSGVTASRRNAVTRRVRKKTIHPRPHALSDFGSDSPRRLENERQRSTGIFFRFFGFLRSDPSTQRREITEIQDSEISEEGERLMQEVTRLTAERSSRPLSPRKRMSAKQVLFSAAFIFSSGSNEMLTGAGECRSIDGFQQRGIGAPAQGQETMPLELWASIDSGNRVRRSLGQGSPAYSGDVASERTQARRSAPGSDGKDKRPAHDRSHSSGSVRSPLSKRFRRRTKATAFGKTDAAESPPAESSREYMRRPREVDRRRQEVWTDAANRESRSVVSAFETPHDDESLANAAKFMLRLLVSGVEQVLGFRMSADGDRRRSGSGSKPAHDSIYRRDKMDERLLLANANTNGPKPSMASDAVAKMSSNHRYVRARRDVSEPECVCQQSDGIRRKSQPPFERNALRSGSGDLMMLRAMDRSIVRSLSLNRSYGRPLAYTSIGNFLKVTFAGREHDRACIRIGNYFIAIRQHISWSFFEVFDPRRPARPGYPIYFDERRGWLLGFVFKPSLSIADSSHFTYSFLTDRLREAISPTLLDPSIDAASLSSPNSRGVARSSTGRRYLALKEGFIPIERHPVRKRFHLLGSPAVERLWCAFNEDSEKFDLLDSKSVNGSDERHEHVRRPTIES